MKPIAFLIKYKLHHIFFWILLMATWYFLRYQDYASESIALTVTLIKVIDLAFMVYITNYILIPRLLYKRNYALFVVVFILMILVTSIAKMNILAMVTGNTIDLQVPGALKTRFYDNVVPHFFLVLSGAAIKLMLDYNRMQQRIAELGKEKAEAELNFLKSQINPHFLFNSLNSVYFLIDKNNATARNALHKFSGMLRYQLYEMDGERIPIEKEIEYLRDYVEMQKLRKDENCTIEFNCGSDVKGFDIEPLLFIPFVENGFKHISHLKNRHNYIKISLKMQDEKLLFCMENSKEENLNLHKEPVKARHAGIGLVNVKRRLALLYPGRHHLEIEAGRDKYIVHLRLKIKNHANKLHHYRR